MGVVRFVLGMIQDIEVMQLDELNDQFCDWKTFDELTIPAFVFFVLLQRQL
jgi:hypothetical protein